MKVIEWEEDRAELFGKDYFNGGRIRGGYASDTWGAFRDFPVHEVTFKHVMARHPESVLELGAARGYLTKRFQDAGLSAVGLEISKHCWMTRVADRLWLWDLCKTPWGCVGPTPDTGEKFDLCFSIATMEHVPEEFLPAVIGEMKRICKRGLHGIDFGGHDDGFDKTHCTLRDKVWWIAKFNEHAPGWPVEVVDKESLEQGDFPQEVLRDDGKIKVNVGSFTTMAWHGWSNIDIAPCHQFAQMNNYRFLQHDLRNGMPYNTACVDLIMMHHFLEHLTLEDGLKCLKDCRRVMRPEGVLRIVLPDVRLLADKYLNGQLDEYGEINDGCAAHHTKSGRFWSLVFPGHQHAYDIDGLCWALTEAGFDPHPTSFRQTQCGERGRQILKETQEMGYELSLFCEATPRMD